MSEREVNPYAARDITERPSNAGFLKRASLAFLILFIPMLVMPHSGGSSSITVGSTITKTKYRNYGLPKWLMKKESNGVAFWSTDPLNLGVLSATAGGLALFFGWLTTPRSAWRAHDRKAEEPKR